MSNFKFLIYYLKSRDNCLNISPYTVISLIYDCIILYMITLLSRQKALQGLEKKFWIMQKNKTFKMNFEIINCITSIQSCVFLCACTTVLQHMLIGHLIKQCVSELLSFVKVPV